MCIRDRTVLCCMLIGMVMSAYGLLFPDAFARMLGASPQLMQGVKDYLQPLHCVALIYILNCTMQVIIRADYNPKLVMLAAVCGNATNIILDVYKRQVVEPADFTGGIFPVAAFRIPRRIDNPFLFIKTDRVGTHIQKLGNDIDFNRLSHQIIHPVFHFNIEYPFQGIKIME